MSTLSDWLSALAQFRLVRADALASLHASIQQQQDVIIRLKADLSEARLDAALQEGKHLATADKLAAEHTARLNAEDATRLAQEASERLWADLRASQSREAVLRGDLATSQGQLKAAQEREAEHLAQIADFEQRMALGATAFDELKAQVVALQVKLRPYELPPYPDELEETRTGDWMREKVSAIVHPPVVPGSVGPPQFLDATYRVLPASAYQPIIDHWRMYLMPPPKEDLADCDNRAYDFAVWTHRWSRYELQIGIADGTTPWALLPSGERGAHVFNIVVDPDGKVWAIDPAFLREPQPWAPGISAGFVRF